MDDLTKKIGAIWNNDEHKRKVKAKTLYDLYEGCIEKHVYERIKREIQKTDDVNEIASRMLEINLVNRIVKKIAKAYKIKPIRRLINATPLDQEMFDWYSNIIDFDVIGQRFDKSYNNYKECLVNPYFHKGTMLPAIKVFEPFEYIVISEDEQDKTIPTMVVRDYGKDANNNQLLAVTTDTSFWVQTVDGEIRNDVMAQLGNDLGINPFGKLPFVYSRQAESTCMPYPDDALINTSTLIPMLCGDINFAIKYMSFGMVWGRNVHQELIERAPNAFLNLTPKDENSQVVPEVGTIKPDLDINEVFNGIMTQLQIWLNSRGITASVIKANESVASGIAKMIDEADVSAIVTSNQTEYRKIERAMFDFIMHHAHDIWKNDNIEIPQKSFSPDCYVETQFALEEPIKTKMEIITEVKEELQAGFISKKLAIKKVNSNLTDEELEELMAEIAEDKAEMKAEKAAEFAAKQVPPQQAFNGVKE